MKRIIWWTAGALMGAGGSTYLQIKFRKAVQAKVARFAPPNLVDVATGKAKDLRGRMSTAVHEGRSAMATRESELRGRVANRAEAKKAS